MTEPKQQEQHEVTRKLYQDVFRGDMSAKKPVISFDPRVWRNHDERRDLADGVRK